MRSKSPRRRLSLALAVTVVAAAASAGIATTGTASTTTKQKTIRIGLVLPVLSNPFISGVRDGAVAEAKKLGNVEVLVTGTNAPSGQLNAMKTYLAAKVDALMYDPIDSSAIAPAVQQANELDIPVIAVIGGTEKGKLATLISPPWYKAGLAAGKQIANGWCKARNPCKVGLVGGSNAPGPGLDSGKGMIAGVKSAPNVKLVQVVYTDYGAEQSLKAAQQILTGHPDINFVMAWWSVGTISTESAIRAANKTGTVGTASLSGACPVLKDLLAGNVYTDVMMFPELMGKVGVDSAIQILQGKTVPEFQSSPMYLITKTKADAILAGKVKAPADVPVLQHLRAAKAGCK